MKKVILKFIVIVSCCTFSINKAQCKTNSVAELKEDAAFIYKTYITNSPRPYLYCDSAELKRNYDIFLSQLTHPMSRWEFIPYAQEFISKANDVHSRIFAEGEMGLRAFFIKVPYFTIRVKSNGQMFVNQILNPKSKLKQGYEIRKINKLSVDSLEKLAAKYYSNESQTIKYVQLENYFNIDSWLIFGIKKSCTVEYIDSTGKLQTETLSGMNVFKYLFNRDQQTSNEIKPSMAYTGKLYGNQALPIFWAGINAKKVGMNKEPISSTIASYWEIPQSKTGIFYIKSFEKPGPNMRKFCDSMFMHIKNNKIENLVIDLRENLGGDSKFIPFFLQYFYSGTFKFSSNYESYSNKEYVEHFRYKKDFVMANYFEKNANQIIKADTGNINTSKYLSFFVSDSNKKVLLKKIIILSNYRAVSLAPKFAESFRYNIPNVITIGEESSDLVCAKGMPMGFLLPNTKLMLKVSASYMESPYNNCNKRGFVPDILVNEDDIEKELDSILSKN